MQRLIRSLQSDELIAGCPECENEFSLSDALLFDGTVEFPELAETRRREYETELKQRRAELRKQKIHVDEESERRTIATRIGQMIEHIVPAFEAFKFRPADCRALFDPIDLMVFNGLSKAKVISISFLEVKTGQSRLNKHQRMIRDAVHGKEVYFEEV